MIQKDECLSDRIVELHDVEAANSKGVNVERLVYAEGRPVIEAAERETPFVEVLVLFGFNKHGALS